MADSFSIMSELGDDTDLLLAPDAWLENQRISLQQKMALMAEQLEGILVAQRIKWQLQQRNMVAIRCVESQSGKPTDVVIKICPVNDAIARLADERRDRAIPADVSEESERQQLNTWRLDGYDIEASKRLNTRRKQHG